ncbi:hypothetical protein [Methanobrevibacter sp.]|uniref:hypothetical protein n=1 Tax=Methanobrevibacter sp. TaxID=66852 RepID=UPI00388F5789
MNFTNMFSNESYDEIRRYFQSPFLHSEYRQAIESVLNAEILSRIDNDTFDMENVLKNRNDEEISIIRSLVEVMKRQLRWVKLNNTTGYFGVIKNRKGGYNWSYLNLIENRYNYSNVIYARSLEELEAKVRQSGHIWYIFDEEMAEKTLRDDAAQKPGRIVSKVVRTYKKPEKDSRFKGLSVRDEIKKKREMQDKVLRRNARPTSMIEKMFV